MIYQVYVKSDDKNRVTAVESSGFLNDVRGWTHIDEGIGDRYYLAQGNYLDKPIMDERGICRYKLVDGEVQERTQEEMDADYAARPAPPPDDKARITALENQQAAWEAAYQRGVQSA